MSSYKLRIEKHQQLYTSVDNITAHNAEIYTENNKAILIYTGGDYTFKMLLPQIPLLKHVNLNNLLLKNL